MRDDVLREVFSAARRERVWRRVKAVVEMNSNVRAAVREGRLGEVARVWEWIGSVGLVDDGAAWMSAAEKGRERYSLGTVGASTPDARERDSPAAVEGRREVQGGEGRRWDEGRPVY